MKKRLRVACAVLGLVICMSFSACGKTSENSGLPAEKITPDQTVEEQPTVTPLTPGINNSPEDPETPEPSAEQPQETTTTPEEKPPETPAVTVPVVIKDTLLCSTTDGLNVRQGAGTSYKVLCTLDKGDMVMPIERSGDWYKVHYMNGVAYVSASYVKTVEFTKASETVEKVIDEGKKLLGIPYEYGAQRYLSASGKLNSAFTGDTYDCSSLMQYIFKKGANINLGLTTRDQCLQGTEVARANIRRGDLLFFTNASRADKTGIERVGHVALYLGDNYILHTASDHAVIEPITTTRWGYYITARRII